MGLFQNLLETYEKCKDATLPIFHTTFKSQICIILDSDGNFINATRDTKDITVVIPCTDRSAGRSSGIAAHPLCDQLDYVGGISNDKTSDYLQTLGEWEKQAEGIAKDKLKAIHNYVSTGTMISDLESKTIFKDAEYDTKNSEKILDNEKTRKIGVRFSVDIKNNPTPEVWEDKILRQSWIDYIRPQNDNSGENLFDYLSGMPIGQVASQHPKNINSATGNAKLLSCNDTSGYTFRGRFSAQDDAVIIDYEQSQKMHQTLRWLNSNYGYNVDSQTIITWAVDEKTSPPVKPHENSFDMFDVFSDMDSVKTDADKLSGAEEWIYADYSRKLKKLLQGYGTADSVKKHARKICIAIFDAATTGRMGLTFYQELFQDEYQQRIVDWHEETKYYLTAWKKEKDDQK